MASLVNRRRAALLSASVLAGAAVLAPVAARAQAGLFLYVPNFNDNNASVYTTAATGTLTPTTTIGVGTGPLYSAVRGDQSFAYVTNQNSNNVSVINTATQAVVQTVSTGNGPEGVAVSPDGTHLYVGNVGSNTVSVYSVNVTTGQLSAVTTINTGAGTGPRGLATSPDGTRLYVADENSNQVSVINTATNTVLTTVSVGLTPRNVAVNPAGTRAYVINGNDNTVSVIDTSSNTVIATVPTGSVPIGVVVSPNGSHFYVTNRNDGTVSVYDATTNTLIASISSGTLPFGVAINPDGTMLYVTNIGANNVVQFTVDPTTGLLTANGAVAAGNQPGEQPGICRNGSGMLASGATFVANTSGAISCVGSTAAFTGGTLLVNGASLSSGVAVSLGTGGGTINTNGNSLTLSGAISGGGGLTKSGAGTLTLSGTSTYTGATMVNAGTLQAGATNAFSPSSAFTVASGATLDLASFNQTIGSLAGAGSVTLGSGVLTAGSDNTSTTFSGAISGTGGVTKIGSGTLTLSGINAYSGATMVNAGTLTVNGSIANSAVTVNSGATLAGAGTVGATTIMGGGTFAPGNSPGTMTVAGNLAFQPGALYLVQVTPSVASGTNVTGSATLAGTADATFAAGSYVTRSYDILHAAGGLGGTTFGGLTTANLPAGFQASLIYTANDVILNLTGVLAIGGGLSINQGNVANALNNFFNTGGALPPNFVTVFGLTGSNLGNALSQLSGEAATGAQQGAFQLMGQFLGVMLDPFVDGRGGIGVGGAPLGFAPERASMPDDVALAYAKVLKAPPTSAPTFEQRWTAWGAAYGGTNRTSGDQLVVGSHDLDAHTWGVAAGADYHLTPDTVVGFGLAGGATGWDLAQGLGTGRSDAFQAGVYGASRWGPAYVAGSLAFANHWMSTDRFAAFADHLTARFDAQSFGVRVEGGYRFGTPRYGIAPYAAVQAQSFHTPAYSETDLTGGGFALSYNARTATDTRSELGARFDHVAAVTPSTVLTLRAQLAWAHDWVSDPTAAPVFQVLPGASFIINGATPATDSALASAGAELRLANGISLLAKFDGEFAAHSSTYAGTGTLRYVW
jgi:YVTN family beta-propeller protein/autotransporter-associated beta strand protein